MRTFTAILITIVALAIFAPGLLSSIFGGALAITISGFVGLFMVGLVMLIVGVMFGSTLLALLAGAIALLFVGISVLWPLLIIGLLVWLCCRGRSREVA